MPEERRDEPVADCGLAPGCRLAALLDDFGHGPTKWKAQMFIFEAMDMGPHMASMTDTTVEDL